MVHPGACFRRCQCDTAHKIVSLASATAPQSVRSMFTRGGLDPHLRWPYRNPAPSASAGSRAASRGGVGSRGKGRSPAARASRSPSSTSARCSSSPTRRGPVPTVLWCTCCVDEMRECTGTDVDVCLSKGASGARVTIPNPDLCATVRHTDVTNLGDRPLWHTFRHYPSLVTVGLATAVLFHTELCNKDVHCMKWFEI